MEMKLKDKNVQEKILNAPPGLPVLIGNILFMIAATVNFVVVMSDPTPGAYMVLSIILFIVAMVVAPFIFPGIKVLHPNEALVLTLFGQYYGTLQGPGMFFVHPFCVGVNPAVRQEPIVAIEDSAVAGKVGNNAIRLRSKKISLKNMTLNNEKQKINDLLGNPIIIGIVVIWKVNNTAKAVFNVDNYREFLSIQCDSALRDVVRMYPYDVSVDGDEKSLRGSSQEVAHKLQNLIQERVEIAGLEIVEARITHLSYAQEIAAAMLQRQQAAAIIDARKMIVEGAVGMVDLALTQLSEENIVELDEERKAAMVSNLLVVLCANKDTQPIVNSGSLY